MSRIPPFVLLFALAGLAACGSSALDPFSETRLTSQTRPGDDPTSEPDDPSLTPAPQAIVVVGTITEVPSLAGTASFLIEENPARPLDPAGSPLTAGEKYHVTVTGVTRIALRSAAGVGRPATAPEIVVGMQAEVWLIGPIRESYPAQAEAEAVMLYERP